MVVETCPKCGNYLQTIVLTSYPPIPKKICYHCGWSWIGDQESVEKVIFEPFESKESDKDDFVIV